MESAICGCSIRHRYGVHPNGHLCSGHHIHRPLITSLPWLRSLRTTRHCTSVLGCLQYRRSLLPSGFSPRLPNDRLHLAAAIDELASAPGRHKIRTYRLPVLDQRVGPSQAYLVKGDSHVITRAWAAGGILAMRTKRRCGWASTPGCNCQLHRPADGMSGGTQAGKVPTNVGAGALRHFE
jgi:hypothetical protein